jgi:hypothetical protein
MLNTNFNPYEIITTLQHQVIELQNNQKKIIEALNNQGRALDSVHHWQGTTNNSLIFQTQTIQSILELVKTPVLDQHSK